ncbi:hypothetical protein ERX37_08280 [Macrococcus hajekii]|uniref:Uncharacterized protein n=1 Tax=Macrococcus hajekii TaxID=198482 RepID=A0A4R6BIL4_9STAP|nr:hypothetical protein [Macrococcus hajekii]TDM01485.1 hypothetical protein ERX37_08280 [Macrococcus hajekii]GGB00343.1 hypothetical protein GCM10007190_05540 [Macrococcus hajekii]
MPKQQLPVKRWSMLDTINTCLLIVVCLFVIDFQKNATLSWVIIIAFAIWIMTVIVRNLYLSKNRK